MSPTSFNERMIDETIRSKRERLPRDRQREREIQLMYPPNLCGDCNIEVFRGSGVAGRSLPKGRLCRGPPKRLYYNLCRTRIGLYQSFLSYSHAVGLYV